MTFSEDKKERQSAGRTPQAESESIPDVLRLIAHAPPRTPPVDPERGTRWGKGGRYVIERRLGRGGMGTVYLAFDERLDRQVALKVLDAGENAREDAQRKRLIREAQLAAKLQHERVATIYDVDDHEGSTFVAMEYVRGVTLRIWMNEPHSPAEVCRIVIQIAEGLSALHQHGVFHRDLKPENVMLEKQGGVKLLDFGLAGHVAPNESIPARPQGQITSLNSASSFGGTAGYMAPEQYTARKADARADVFALGVVAFELIARERPFIGKTLEELSRAVEEQAVKFDGVEWKAYPPSLAQIVNQMLKPKVNDRYPNGGEVLKALEGLRASLLPAPGARPPRRPRHRWAVVVGLLALIVVASVAVPRLVRERERRKPLSAVPRGMALVDAGTVAVGHTARELDEECVAIGPKCNREKMQREVPGGLVNLEPFFLDLHEVTNAEMTALLNMHVNSLVVTLDEDDHYPRYARFNAGLGHDGELIADLNSRGDIEYTSDRKFRTKAGFERMPASRITWFGANLYCQSLGKRLPAENEWEAAARGRENRQYPWGNAPMHCGGAVVAPDGMILMDKGCRQELHAGLVGAAPQDVTPEGIHDLAGNVGEWTATAYVDDDRMATTDGKGDIRRVIRGGSWAAETSYLARTSGRTFRQANGAGTNVGFRCASSPLSGSNQP